MNNEKELRLGIDVEAIIARNGSPFLSGEKSRFTSAVSGAITCIHELMSMLSDKIYPACQCDEPTRIKVLEWMLQHKFYTYAGIISINLHFGDISHICELLRLTHFISNNVERLISLPHGIKRIFLGNYNINLGINPSLPAKIDYSVATWHDVVRIIHAETAVLAYSRCVCSHSRE